MIYNSSNKSVLRENYLPWNLNIQDFFSKVDEEEKIKFLLSFAVLAPSSHNSQPWSFSIEKNNIKVLLDAKKTLPVADDNHRQSYISLGCAIENIIIAADYYGYISELFINDNDEIYISLAKKNNPAQGEKRHLIFEIQKRRVNRGKYLNKAFDHKILETIQNFQDENIMVSIISNPKDKEDLADITLNATAESMSNKKFRNELSKYIIPNNSTKKFGMPGKGLGFPSLISFIVPFLLRKINLSKLSNKQDGKILKNYTPYFFVLSTKEDNKKSWIMAGRFAERTFLTLTQNNISTAVWGAPIQINNFYKEIKALLKINFRPQLLFRAGYAIEDRGYSPRYNVEDTIV